MSTNKLTIKQAQAQISKLEDSIHWIESVVDQRVREELEVNIDPPPAEIRIMLNNKLAEYREHKRLLEQRVKYTMEELSIIEQP